MRGVLAAIVLCLCGLAIIEVALRETLFARVSYSNSESIDRQIIDRDKRADWNILFIGDSETRWGIHPGEIDAAFSRRGLEARSFNHALDGFGVSWWGHLLPPLLQQPSLREVKVVVLGVQMIDAHGIIGPENCGALQIPVLTSPFGTDLGVDSLCRKQSWDAAVARKLFGGFWTVRYSSAVRTFIFPRMLLGGGELKFNSRKDGEPDRGFEPHRSIAQDRDIYEREFSRWKAQYQPEQDFVPLPAEVWSGLTAPTGLFDELKAAVENSGRQLVLFALPTNPAAVDTFRRREDYLRNARLLAQWAQGRGVVFVDLGIQDVTDPELYFSDMRHLSGTGARLYSKRLGDWLAARVDLRSAPHTSGPNAGTRP